MAMSEREQPDLADQVQRLDFAAALRHEQEQAFQQPSGVQVMPLWLLAMIWMAIGAVLFGGGLFVGWVTWHH